MLKSKPWYKKWWGVIIVIFILPYFFVWFIWAKTKWFKLFKGFATLAILGVTGFVTLAVLLQIATMSPSSPDTTATTNSSIRATAPTPTNHTPTTADKLNAVLTSLKQKYPSITTTYLVSKDRDPDMGYGQSGYYNAGAAFCDDPNTTEQPSDSVTAGSASNAYGFECGGVIEVYPSEAGVATRVAYFHSLDGDPQLAQCQTVNKVQVCDFKQVGDVFLHLSDLYQPSQWTDMLNYLTQQVQAQQL